MLKYAALTSDVTCKPERIPEVICNTTGTPKTELMIKEQGYDSMIANAVYLKYKTTIRNDNWDFFAFYLQPGNL